MRYEIDIIVNENRIYQVDAQNYREALDKAATLFRNGGRKSMPKGVEYVETLRVWNTYIVSEAADGE